MKVELLVLLGLVTSVASSITAAAAVDHLGDALPSGALQRLGTLRMRCYAGGLAYLPDGRGVILTGGYVDIWDLVKGERQSHTNVSKQVLISLDVRGDGNALLLGDRKGRVCEWDVATQRELRHWDTGHGELRSVRYSPDGTRMLTAGNGPTCAKEWDLSTGNELICLKSEMTMLRPGAIYGPGGKSAILGGGYTHNLERFDLATGQLLKKWCTIYQAKDLDLSPDRKCLLVGVEDRAREWSLEDYTVFRDYKHCPGEAARIYAHAYRPSQNEVVCGGRDGVIRRWSRSEGKLLCQWPQHQGPIMHLALSPDEQWALTYGSGRVAETDLDTGEPRVRWHRHGGSVETAAFLPDGRRVVSASSDATLRVWDTATGKTLLTVPRAKLGAYALAVSPDGERVAAGCKDSLVRVFSLDDGQVLSELDGHRGFVRALAYTRDGARLLSAADDGSVCVWNSRGDQPGARLEGHRGGVLALAVSDQDERALSGGRDGTVRLWDLRAGKLLQTWRGHRSWVHAVAFAGRGAVSAGADKRVLRWDIASGEADAQMERTNWLYYALAISPDGRTVYAAGNSFGVTCWDLATGKRFADLRGHKHWALALAVSPDGRRLVTGSRDTTLLVWNAPARPDDLPPGMAAPKPQHAASRGVPEAGSAADTFGCEANPTGNPIGGGPGYKPVLNSGDFTVKTKEELLEALKAAKAGHVIFVPHGVEIDMTGEANIRLPGGVALAGTRGLDGSHGARIFTTWRKSHALMCTAGEDVRVTGLRFEGAFGGTEKVADHSHFLGIGHSGAEVDNCEIYNFNVTGISVAQTAIHVRIHHNHIHHCQRSGYGYGVVTGSSNVHIIANKLDYCRHVIASGGQPGCGYEAAWNLVGPHATSHHFDMHGGSDRGDATNIAGDWMDIHHNTFLGEVRAVVIRGVPSQRAEVHHNWFAAPTKQTVLSRGNTQAYRNLCGPEKRLEEGPISFAEN